jgi:phage baseplate assembly protein W
MTSASVTQTPDVSITDTQWLDVNTLLDVNGKPDLLPGVQAVNNSLYNLFRCHIGGRSAIFDPEYGTGLYLLLQEPIDYITAGKIQMFLIQAIQRWEPRIQIDMGRTSIKPDVTIPGYVISIYYTLVGTGQDGNYTINLSNRA